jgi:predicted glutamine amidotransferase
MSVFWGLSINSSANVECAIMPFAEHLKMCTGDVEGWGLGYYYRGDILQRIEPQKQGELLDVEKAVHDITADIILMHTRTATVGSARPENVHPFRFQDWLFAHNGTLAGFETFKEDLQHHMPPFILRGIKGDTDSQYIFHLFLSFLYDAGMLNRPNPGSRAVRDALVRTFATLDEFAKNNGEGPSPASLMVSDGYSLVVLRRGIPVEYLLIEGLNDCRICRPSVKPGEADPDHIDHGEVRAVMVRSGAAADDTSRFISLEDNAILMVTKKQTIEVSKLS